jgi:hypothetical protein
MKQIVARAGERTKILHIFSDSIPQQVRFAASPLVEGEPLGGTVEVVRSHWFIKAPPEVSRLRAEQAFDKRFADVDYAIYVTPESDVRIAFQSRHFERRTLFAILGVVLALGVFGALFSLVAPLLFAP